MKRIYYTLIASLFLMLSGIRAQDCDIALSVIIPEHLELPEATRNGLANKLRQVVTQNGLGARSHASQFAITATLSVVNKNILPGPPMQTSYTMNVHLYIVDQKGEKIFSSTNFEAKGVGTNEQKAYADAIRKINARSKDTQQFVAIGREKILNYYNTQYPSILKTAEALADRKNFDEALFQVLRIPECSKGYDSALLLSVEIYQKYIDQVCAIAIANARTAWMAEQNASGAMNAGTYLSAIYPDAACYREAMELYREIKSKIADDWKFEMKKYDDSISLESQRIEMMKAVGEAYGAGQQGTTHNLTWLE